jgi:triosephosphate isomerase
MPSAALAGETAPGKISVAYEPVWAIGTGRVAAVDDVVAMHRAIRATLTELYGDLLAADDVGGALVGGASLTAESFLAIVAAAGVPAES